jgi:hypothetical protein
MRPVVIRRPSVNPITNPNPVYSHSYPRQYTVLAVHFRITTTLFRVTQLSWDNMPCNFCDYVYVLHGLPLFSVLEQLSYFYPLPLMLSRLPPPPQRYTIPGTTSAWHTKLCSHQYDTRLCNSPLESKYCIFMSSFPQKKQ